MNKLFQELGFQYVADPSIGEILVANANLQIGKIALDCCLWIYQWDY